MIDLVVATFLEYFSTDYVMQEQLKRRQEHLKRLIVTEEWRCRRRGSLASISLSQSSLSKQFMFRETLHQMDEVGQRFGLNIVHSYRSRRQDASLTLSEME